MRLPFEVFSQPLSLGICTPDLTRNVQIVLFIPQIVHKHDNNLRLAKAKNSNV